MTTASDLWEAAENAETVPMERNFFGRVYFDLWKCALVKGVGKVPYNPTEHERQRPFTCVEVSIVPLPSLNVDWTTDRSMIAEFEEWTAHTLPSVKALNVRLSELHQKWVQYEMVESGRTWKNQEGNTVKATVPVFKAVYNSEAEAEAAAAAMFGGNGSNGDGPVSLGGEGDNDPVREAAAAFLPAMWDTAGHDVTTFMASIQSNPLLAPHFDLNAPEVKVLITK